MTLTNTTGEPTPQTVAELGACLARMSEILDVDPDIAAMPPGQRLWTRTVGKVTEENGEAAAALIALQGGNPRKNRIRVRWWRLIRRYRAWREWRNFTPAERQNRVIKELLDIMAAAGGGVEYMTGNQGHSIALLAEHAPNLEHRLRRAVTTRLAERGDITTVVP